MKKLSLFIFGFMFLANTVVVSAWAMPCLMNESIAMSQHINSSMPDEMPCHEEQKEEKSKYCEGICFCFHTSVSQTPIMNGSESLNIPMAFSENLRAENEKMVSLATSPPRRPPKIIS